MKLLSEKAEFVALRTVCSFDRYPKEAARLLAFLSADHFHHPLVKKAFVRVKDHAKKRGEILPLTELLSDPKLPETDRTYLGRKLKKVKSISSSQFDSLKKILDRYFKLRTLAFSAETVLKRLEDDSVDMDELMDYQAQQLVKARSSVNTDSMLYHFGKGRNTKRLERRIINGELPALIPTGFKTYDEQCGGIREKSVWVLTANTGGLKSSVAKTLARNMYRNANNVAIASFEMDEEEVAIRMMSEMTDIELRLFMEGKLSLKQKRMVQEKFDLFNKWGAKKGCRFTIMSATDSDLDIDQTFAALEPFGHRVIFVDYIGLLADADKDEQWKSLSRVARKSKMFAKRTNCVVVLLAQLSDDDQIRYAKGVGEHADYWWRWRITDEVRELRVFEILQAKARHGRIFKFEMGVKFETNSIYNLTDNAFGKNEKTSKKYEVIGEKKNGKPMQEIGAEDIIDVFDGEDL